jgi:hypothetical protein
MASATRPDNGNSGSPGAEPGIENRAILWDSGQLSDTTANYNRLVLDSDTRLVVSKNRSTWSRCITAARGKHINTVTWSYLNPNRRGDRGNCSTDRRNVLITAVTRHRSFQAGHCEPSRRLAVFTNFSFSRRFHDVLSGHDRALTALANQRADQILGSPYGDKTIGKYLNPAAFAQPALGALGNAGSNSILGPGTTQFDLAVSRTFQFGEMKRVEFRTEAFNVTNSFLMNTRS